jgi:very-short-patch-repair endonuclease
MPRPNRARQLATSLDHLGALGRGPDLLAKFGRASLDTALAQGLVVRLTPGLFAHAARAQEFATRVNAADAWMPRGSAVSGLAALAMYELTLVPPSLITVAAPRHTHLLAPSWVRLVRTQMPLERQMRYGVRCVSREQALIHAWAESAPDQRVSTVLEAMRRSHLTGSSALGALELFPRVTARRQLEHLLAKAHAGIESYLELQADRTVLTGDRLKNLYRQFAITAMGKHYVVDAYDSLTRTAIEFDGARYHSSAAARQRDSRRDADLATLGILTLRFTYDDVINRPAWCRERILRTLAARAGGG